MPSELTHKPTIHLTAEQINFYHENGFLWLPQLSTPEELTVLRAAYDRIFEQRAGREEGNQFDLAGTDEEGKEAALPQILNPEKYAPELWDTQARANALQVVRQLMGEDMQAQGSHAIFKPARHGAATPWHQDEAYWSPDFQYRSMSVWMPLQDVDAENGCMQFIPGSHKLEIVQHQPINNDPRIHGLELAPSAGVNTDFPVICPLQAGGATFHPGRTLHYTAPNNSNRPRRALIMGFGGGSARRSELGLPERRFPWNEMKKTAKDERARAARESAGK
jgi:ectoine hydroxylase-related dioxygenase (phytanoyl-CoA dioxygenase family)